MNVIKKGFFCVFMACFVGWGQKTISSVQIEGQKIYSSSEILHKNQGEILLFGQQKKIMSKGFWGDRISLIQNGIFLQEQQYSLSHGSLGMQFLSHQSFLIDGTAALLENGNAFGSLFKNELLPLNEKGFLLLAKAQWNKNPLSFMPAFEIQKNTGKINAILGFSTHWEDDLQTAQKKWFYRGENYPIVDQKLTNTGGQNFQGYGQIDFFKKNYYLQIHSSYNYQKSGILPLFNWKEKTEQNQLFLIQAPFLESQHLQNHFQIKNPEHFEYFLGFQWNRRRERADYFLNHDLQLWDLQQKYQYTFHFEQDQKVILGVYQSFQIHQKGAEDAMFLVPNFWQFQIHLPLYYLWKINENQNFSAAIKPQYFHYQDQSFADTKALQKQHLNFSAAASYENIWDFGKMDLSLNKKIRFPNANEYKSSGSHYAAFRFEKGNTHLRPEEGIGLEKKLLFWYPLGQIELKSFAYYYWNFIFLYPTGKYDSNIGGGQIYLYTQTPVLQLGFSLENHFEYAGFFHEFLGDYLYLENLDRAIGMPLVPAPKIYQKMGYQKKYFWGNWQIFIDHLVRFPTIYYDINENFLPAYQLLGAGLDLGFKTKKDLFYKFFVKAQNITNALYKERLSIFEPLNLYEKSWNFQMGFIFECFQKK